MHTLRIFQEEVSSSHGDVKDAAESSEDMDSNTRRSMIRNTRRVEEKLGAILADVYRYHRAAIIEIIFLKSFFF